MKKWSVLVHSDIVHKILYMRACVWWRQMILSVGIII